ncbi:hypothetical protein BTR23_18595 [Alkalihalophilus pseudofirmus]|nr:hypothetical protein BTR23_18595 [Alkalihalophilus pseudofirmus]
MIKRVHHIDLRVKNLEASVSYFKRLGFQELRKTSESRLSVEVVLPGPDQVIFELRQGKDNEVGINHIAFLKENDSALDGLKKNGIEFNKEVRFVKDTGRSVINFTDIDGNKWQLTD